MTIPTRLAESDTPRSAIHAAEGEMNEPGSAWNKEPTPCEVVGLSVLSFVVFVAVVLLFDDLASRVPVFGDNKSYIEIASAIRRWDFQTLQPYHFWGYPYLIALLSLGSGLSESWSLLVVSLGSALIASWLIAKLWSGWVAAWFLVLSLEWQQRAVLGGAEPTFMALCCGAFLMARRNRWITAALMAALATVVRPVGLFALIGIGIALLAQQRFRTALAATAVALGVGILYVMPLQLYFSDPLANARIYQGTDWSSASPVTIPLLPIIRGYLSIDLPVTTIVRQGFWVILFVVACVAMVMRPHFRVYARHHVCEFVFAVSQILFVFSYNSSVWAWADFARYALPAAPIALFALREALPRDRRVVWTGAFASALLAAASGVGARRVLAEALHRLRR